eukprot:TRINITY_DN28557_c0_g1_i1.p1 TRINITY_DN28557_c0_g1~~TRINITY_DN28557_c0_g1_i1.p1  ORF type:complete len:483 (+),score=59.12 TRINITY_DN28557_c0_g1_i1:84-1532(+)
MGLKGVKNDPAFGVLLIPPLFCTLLGLWLIACYAEQESSFHHSGPNSPCRRALLDSEDPDSWHIDVDTWMLWQGLLNVLTVGFIFCISVQFSTGCERPGLISFGLVTAAHIGFLCWGSAEVWSASYADCGELLYQGRIFIIMTYCIILLAVCMFMTGVCCQVCDCDVSMPGSQLQQVAGCWWCLMLAMWVGVFFGVLMPEVHKNMTWQAARCTVKSVVGTADYQSDPQAALAARVPCCSRLCSGCRECSGMTSCDSLISGPEARPNGTSDGRHCAGDYYCCQQCCHTCCTSDKDGTSCSSCDCYCCDWVNHRCCHVECQWCYSASYLVEVRDQLDGFLVSHGEKLKMCDVCRRHGCEEQNLKTMKAFLTLDSETIVPGVSHQCWYNPSDLSDFDWHLGYTKSRWVLLLVPTAFLFYIPLAFVGFGRVSAAVGGCVAFCCALAGFGGGRRRPRGSPATEPLLGPPAADYGSADPNAKEEDLEL